VRKAEAANAEDAAKDGGWPRPLDYQYAPYAWLHVPKCGSSFINALVRVPESCYGLPEDLEVSATSFGELHLSRFWLTFPLNCPNRFVTAGGHSGTGSNSSRNYERLWKGHGVTVLRQPEQRILSAFHDQCHSWPVERLGSPPDDPVKFAQVVQGCAAKMLTRAGNSHRAGKRSGLGALGRHWGGPCGDPAPPTGEELELAKRRLREDFPFVGIQEEWELSICLFHATFGGNCHAVEFLNSRHPHQHSATPYDLAPLRGFQDAYDGELYAEAKAIMRERMIQYNVSVEACQPCFQEAHVNFPR